MAFASGKETTESAGIKHYTGVGTVQILAVNPNKKKLEELYNTTLEKEPEYLTYVEQDGKRTKNLRLDFIVKNISNNPELEVISKVTFFLKDSILFNRDQTKLQVVDKYGRTAWVTNEQYDAKEIPMYSNGPAKLDKNYRSLYSGEEELIQFLIAYLGIPATYKRLASGEYVDKTGEELAECEASLEQISEYFNGNWKELETIIALQPKNKVKVLFGVRTTSEGKEYQTTYNRLFLKYSDKNLDKFTNALNKDKEAGRYSTTEFVVGEFQEYEIKPTSFEAPASVDDPFGTSNNHWD